MMTCRQSPLRARLKYYQKYYRKYYQPSPPMFCPGIDCLVQVNVSSQEQKHGSRTCPSYSQCVRGERVKERCARPFYSHCG